MKKFTFKELQGIRILLKKKRQKNLIPGLRLKNKFKQKMIELRHKNGIRCVMNHCQLQNGRNLIALTFVGHLGHSTIHIH